MSGLEPIAALGLACNIFQIISFGREIITVAKQVYQNGSGYGDSSLKNRADCMHDIASAIEKEYTPSSAGTFQPAKARRLRQISQKCCAAARSLQEEVDFIIKNARTGSLRSAVKVAAKANWRKRRLERLEKELNDCEGLMQFGLLDYIW
ncbi:hypothetical protein QQS21_010926 [Conoideocrella luteorostrata]|uniref:NACHT-NTPase and P-loop NTPases N-terminal domain-containing protein n=1 Tax=Conoideocrella luteorostrata TaxID=1105319 RepID=A0AAJ0CGT1_9HYPO|nr:hypothetical protein QQS21_010926 [Conoideocrella luteorostrata]